MKHKPKNITRMDIKPRKEGYSSQCGWWVRLQKNKKKFHNFFNDNSYGGKDEGLKAAIIFRDAVKLQLASTAKSSNLTSRNTSGIVGVSRLEGPYKSKGYIYIRNEWIATWVDEHGKSCNKAFQINKYGEEEAFRKALDARKKGIAYQRENAKEFFRAPEKLNQKIWRYLDFTKFVSLLENRCLYFSDIDSLNDPFEGSLSKINQTIRPLINKSSTLTPEMISKKVIELRKSVYVNCWHMNDFESAAMWELYSKSNEAVCIQSTYEIYQSQLKGKADVGIIQYVNYEEDYIPEHDPYLAFLYKRKSFSHEQEIRGLVKKEKNSGTSLNIEVDLNSLIQKIYVSPSAPKWLYQLVEQVTSRYGYKFDICQSSLTDEPFF